MKHQNAESRNKALISYSLWLSVAALLFFGMGYSTASIDKTELNDLREQAGNTEAVETIDTGNFLKELDALERALKSVLDQRTSNEAIIVPKELRDGLTNPSDASENTTEAAQKINEILAHAADIIGHNREVSVDAGDANADVSKDLADCEKELAKTTQDLRDLENRMRGGDSGPRQ